MAASVGGWRSRWPPCVVAGGLRSRQLSCAIAVARCPAAPQNRSAPSPALRCWRFTGASLLPNLHRRASLLAKTTLSATAESVQMMVFH